MLAAIVAPEPGAGLTDKAVARRIVGAGGILAATHATAIVGIGIAAERRRGYGTGCPDSAPDNAGGNIARPKPRVVVPAVRPVAPAVWICTLVASVGGAALIVAGVGTVGSAILAIGVGIKLRAIAGIGNDLLRH